MNNKTQWIFLLVLVTGSLFCSGQNKCNDIDTIKGLVTNFNRPVQNATVELFYKKTKIATCFTDSNGSFQFTNIYVADDQFWIRTKRKRYIKDESRIREYYVKRRQLHQIDLDYDPYYLTTYYCIWFAPPGRTIFMREQINRTAH